MLNAYMNGIFPMAESKDYDKIVWIEPRLRGVIPLNLFHTSRSLKRHIKQNNSIVRYDKNFDLVLNGCARRDETWINSTLIDTYKSLFTNGYAHSVEVFEHNKLVGGLFGVSINGAFFGESMYSESTNASKIALKFLTERLKNNGYSLFDTQFISEHLKSLGAIEITQEEYLRLLKSALRQEVTNAFY